MRFTAGRRRYTVQFNTMVQVYTNTFSTTRDHLKTTTHGLYDMILWLVVLVDFAVFLCVI